MNNYCQPLNLNLFPLITSKEFFIRIKKSGHYAIDVEHETNPVLKELLKSLGLAVRRAEAFYRGPKCNPFIHSDTSPGDYVKINWVYGGKDSVMQWFTINPGVRKEVTKNTLGSTVCLYDKSEVTLAYETHIINPSLVQVGAPHNIINPIEDRICISLILKNINNKKVTMAEAQQALISYIS